jgi:acyl-CoA thioesterase FadM
MNNTRYVDLVNLTTIYHFIRLSGGLKSLNMKMFPIFLNFKIHYFKPLILNEKFFIRTQLECADNKYSMWVSSKFIKNNVIVAIAFTKVAFTNRKQLILVDEVKNKMAQPGEIKPISDFLGEIENIDKFILETFKNSNNY